MKRHFVTFYSPGTMFAETTREPIDAWDVNKAVAMARTIKERYNATPYAFQFSTRERGPKDLDSHETKRSVTYHLGGTIKTLAQVEAEHDPKNDILISNMRGNNYKRVIVNDNSWRSVQPLGDDDVVLAYEVKR